MFQSPDGDFVYSDKNLRIGKKKKTVSFNPLTGISSILTPEKLDAQSWVDICFNPLTGISSILTREQSILPLLRDLVSIP